MIGSFYSLYNTCFQFRVEQNVAKRLNELNRLGIPRIVVIGKVTEESLNNTPKMEFLTVEPSSPDLERRGEFTLNELMQVIDC